MSRIDAYELNILNAFEKGKLKSMATKSELAKFKAAARATATKDKRVNIRLSSVDLGDIQVKAMEEGVPYQTLIAGVLHKYVTGRLIEPSVADAKSQPSGASKRRPSV
jgi:predicted DNA binding CopG/RHH family protein